MIYQEATHPKVKVGQLWRCTPPGRETVLIVALDSSPGGLVINALLADGKNINGISSVLAPIAWQQLEPHLAELQSVDMDISEHLASYNEWKELAQDGKAGYFNCAPAEILSTIRNSVDE